MTFGYSFVAAVGGYDINGNPVYVREDVAPLLDGLVRDYAAHGWGRLVILEGGRTLARQTYLWNGWAQRLPGFNTAAYPGTSKHEGGYAVDFGAGWDSYYKVGWTRLAEIAGRWGFDNVQGRNTKPNPEPWHWVCTPKNATTTNNGLQLVGLDPEELDPMPTVQEIVQGIVPALETAIRKPVGDWITREGERTARWVWDNVNELVNRRVNDLHRESFNRRDEIGAYLRDTIAPNIVREVGEIIKADPGIDVEAIERATDEATERLVRTLSEVSFTVSADTAKLRTTEVTPTAIADAK